MASVVMSIVITASVVMSSVIMVNAISIVLASKAEPARVERLLVSILYNRASKLLFVDARG